MQQQIDTLIENIVNEYATWQGRCAQKRTYDVSDIQTKMFDEFKDNIRFEVGRKYIKIITKNSVWGFVVNTDTDKKFRKGDILKAAGYNAPARNAARGNIVDGGYEIDWTGPLYLK